MCTLQIINATLATGIFLSRTTGFIQHEAIVSLLKLRFSGLPRDEK